MYIYIGIPHEWWHGRRSGSWAPADHACRRVRHVLQCVAAWCSVLHLQIMYADKVVLNIACIACMQMCQSSMKSYMKTIEEDTFNFHQWLRKYKSLFVSRMRMCESSSLLLMVNVYLCIHIYMCIYLYIYIYTYTYVCIHLYIYIH